MARERSPLRDKAKELYINSKGEMKLVDIAAELNLKDTQIRKWKSQDKWDNELKGTSKGTLPNKKSQSKSNVTNKKVTKKQNKRNDKEPIADEVKEVLESTELNDKHRLFAVIYSKRFNATKAYQQVYHCTYESAMVNGCLLLRNTKVKALIDELTAIEFNKEALKRGVLQKYIDIALSDIGDYLTFGKKQIGKWTKDKEGIDIPVIDPETGEQKLIEYSYVDLKESISVDTSLITEISEGKDGIRIKLVDKTKALEFLSKHLNLLSDEEKTKLDIENKKLQALKLQADIDKTKAETSRITDNDEGEIEDDGFLEALKGRTTQVWNNE
ncbi:terminase small subunit [Clostridium butyricum]|uniref:terminase small subunit n=1 Tax=Clostridium butyricum TaxID=1492 RepID=UPI0006E64FB0|nr:terminase small subunit [Clostridium butyricum]AXB84798.1 phage portal protein [Clostridium butyricum]KQB77231.1 phage portal protein [Clostridium butyricum]